MHVKMGTRTFLEARLLLGVLLLAVEFWKEAGQAAVRLERVQRIGARRGGRTQPTAGGGSRSGGAQS